MNQETAQARLLTMQEKQLREQQAFIDSLPEEIRGAFSPRKVDKLDSFMANGNKYIIRTSLSIERFTEFEKLQAQVSYGVDFMNMMDNLKKAYQYLNNSKPADGAVIIHNMMNGIARNVDERENPVLELSALYICREGEDVAKYDPELNRAKIQDWKEEGIDINSFFTFAFSLVNGFTPTYKEALASTSNRQTSGNEK